MRQEGGEDSSQALLTHDSLFEVSGSLVREPAHGALQHMPLHKQNAMNRSQNFDNLPGSFHKKTHPSHNSMAGLWPARRLDAAHTISQGAITHTGSGVTYVRSKGKPGAATGSAQPREQREYLQRYKNLEKTYTAQFKLKQVGDLEPSHQLLRSSVLAKMRQTRVGPMVSRKRVQQTHELEELSKVARRQGFSTD